MTPKTNREKADKILAVRPWHSFTEAEKFILFTAAFTKAELYPNSFERLEDFYQHVISLEEGDECPKKEPEYIAEPDFMETEEFAILMRDYRKSNKSSNEVIAHKYSRVKTFIREHFTANTASECNEWHNEQVHVRGSFDDESKYWYIQKHTKTE